MRIALLGPWTRRPLAERLGAAGLALPEGSRGLVVSMLAEELLARGHQVEMVCLDDDVEETTTVEVDRARVTLLPRRRGGRGRDAYAVERSRLRATLAGLDAEVLNAHWSYEYALGSSGHPAPRVVTVHDWAPSVLWYSPDPYRLIRLGMSVAALAGRPRVTAPSPQIARRLRRMGLDRVSVVPNGLDDRSIGAGPRRRGQDDVIMAVADGFGRLKNTRTLIEALPLIRRHVPGAVLRLVGPQHDPEGPARDFAVAGGLTDGVEFLGAVPHDRVLAEMAAADLLVHPAREESFGMVLVEAMAQGTPVVGGRWSGAVPWVLGGGRAGRLVDVTDPLAVATAAGRLLRDDVGWEAMSAAGHAWVQDRFTMGAVAEGYLQAYADAISDRTP